MRDMDISERIDRYKRGDRTQLEHIWRQMLPLIKKYAGRTHFLEYEDACQEYSLTLIEAINKIKNYDNDRLFLAYAVKCIKNRFYTLYKIYRTEPPTESETEDSPEKHSNSCVEDTYGDIVLLLDLKSFISRLSSENRRRIAALSLISQKSDAEIASILGVSRQYVNRIKRELLTELASFYL